MPLSFSRFPGRAFFVAAAIAVSMPAALAQTTDRPSAAAPAATAEANKSNWAVNCGAGESADGPLVCQMMQNVVVQESNQRLLTVIIRPQPEAPNHTLTLVLPHGVDFSKGVEVKIDDKDAVNVAVQTSSPQGAFANLPISDEMLAELKAGKSVTFTFQSVSGQSFAVPISLVGFTAAYEKLAAN